MTSGYRVVCRTCPSTGVPLATLQDARFERDELHRGHNACIEQEAPR